MTNSTDDDGGASQDAPPFVPLQRKGDRVSSVEREGVVITQREIYDAVLKLTGKIDAMAAQHENNSSDIQDLKNRMHAIELLRAADRLTDHENRLRTGESLRWPIPVIMMIIGLSALVLSLYFGLNKQSGV